MCPTLCGSTWWRVVIDDCPPLLRTAAPALFWHPLNDVFCYVLTKRCSRIVPGFVITIIRPPISFIIGLCVQTGAWIPFTGVYEVLPTPFWQTRVHYINLTFPKECFLIHSHWSLQRGPIITLRLFLLTLSPSSKLSIQFPKIIYLSYINLLTSYF